MTKSKLKTRNKSGNIYETAAPNIQKITRAASGVTTYRVRVGTPDGEVSAYAPSLKKAYSVRKQLMA